MSLGARRLALLTSLWENVKGWVQELLQLRADVDSMNVPCQHHTDRADMRYQLLCRFRFWFCLLSFVLLLPSLLFFVHLSVRESSWC